MICPATSTDQRSLASRRAGCTLSALVANTTGRCMCQRRSWAQMSARLDLEPMTTSTRRLERVARSGACKAVLSSSMVSIHFSHNSSFVSTEPINTCIKANVPGPGHYGQGIEINKYGKYSISTYANSRAANWSPSKNRFVDEDRSKKNLPGPGMYHPSDYSGSQGYILSTFKNSGNVKIKLNTYRKSQDLDNDTTPGPGSYVPPSDFGYLELYKSSPRTAASPARTSGKGGITDRISKTHMGHYRPPKVLNKRNSNREMSNTHYGLPQIQQQFM